MRRVLPVVLTLLSPAALRGQADSTSADSALARPAGLGARTVIGAGTLARFLADDPQHVLGLVPGVVLRGAETGLASAGTLSIRGGVPGSAAVYVDGAPVRFLIGGGPGAALGLGSIAAIAVTTGAPDLALPDLRHGVIAYTARAGGERLAGSFRAQTDEGFGGVGFNRFEGGVGGPLPLPDATWYVGGTLTGQRAHFAGLGREDVPSYVPAGIDTTVTRVVGGQTETVALPQYIDHLAYDWGTELRAHAKVQMEARSGASVSLTGIVNQVQERFFPGVFALAPSLYTGARAGARLVVANWRQPLGAVSGGSLTLRVNASLGTNEQMSGLLTPQSELVSADPSLGITLETLEFVGADVMPFPLTEDIIRNVRTNSGLRVPYLNRDELRLTQSSRANPFGMETWWPTQGLDGPLTMAHERRRDARVALDWAVGQGHAITVGGDVSGAELAYYTASLLRQSFMDVYRATPNRTGAHVAYRLGRGEGRAEVALRLDHFDGVGLFPRVPGRIYSNPAFNRPAAINTDTGYTNSLARVMAPGRARDAVSFHAAAERALGPRATVRAAVGRWIEPPPVGLVLLGSNVDLDFANTNDPLGRDVEYGHASLVELGLRHAPRAGLEADLAVYGRSRPVYVFRVQPFDDPANPGDVVNINALANPLQRTDYGAELAVDWRRGSWLTGRLAYGARVSDTPDTGPVGQGDGTFVSHAIGLGAVLRAGGGMLAGFEASLLVRIASGLPYTRLNPAGGTGALAIRPTAFGIAIEPLNASRLPWTRTLDLRLSRATPLGGRGTLAVFADLRNALNVRNVLNLYAESGDVHNANFREQLLDVEFQNLEAEAINNNRLLANGDIDLRPDCGSWTVTSGSGGAVVNCVALRRVEARFGNGDGLYSLAERETALYTFYNAFFGPQTLYGAGRSVRLGVEIRW